LKVKSLKEEEKSIENMIDTLNAERTISYYESRRRTQLLLRELVLLLGVSGLTILYINFSGAAFITLSVAYMFCVTGLFLLFLMVLRD
jgi:hypothetical protein